jgi:MFS transporter, ACS family, pantothenate transporter
MLGGALEAFSTQTCMVLWMKADGGFTVPQNNTYPLGITAIGMSRYGSFETPQANQCPL